MGSLCSHPFFFLQSGKGSEEHLFGKKLVLLISEIRLKIRTSGVRYGLSYHTNNKENGIMQVALQVF